MTQKVDKGFDSDTFTKKILTTAQIQVGEKEGKKNDGVQGGQLKKVVDKNGAKCNMWVRACK